MECERTQDLLSDFLDGSLPEADRADVSSHVRECRICAGAAEGLENTIRLLRNLPPIEAPPELMARIRRETAPEAPVKPLWKKLFLPAHIKIPIEAAAAILLFILVYSVQKNEMPAIAPSPPESRTETAHSAPVKEAHRKMDTGARTAKRGPGEPGRKPEAASRGHEPPRAAPEPGPVAASPSEAPRQIARSALPYVPAQRASTSAEMIRPYFRQAEDTAREDTFPRMSAAPPSRLLMSVPGGRELTLIVAQEDRSGLDERISAAAARTGGSLVREHAAGPAESQAAGPFPDAFRVRVPAGSADAFISELRGIGTIPGAQAPAWTTLPSGPFPATVHYTVRIRVR